MSSAWAMPASLVRWVTVTLVKRTVCLESDILGFFFRVVALKNVWSALILTVFGAQRARWRGFSVQRRFFIRDELELVIAQYQSKAAPIVPSGVQRADVIDAPHGAHASWLHRVGVVGHSNQAHALAQVLAADFKDFGRGWHAGSFEVSSMGL